MKNRVFLLAAIILTTCVFVPASAAEVIPVSISGSIALITDYKGGCTVKPAASADFRSVSFGMPVYEGDEFKTSAESFIEITFDDATLVRLDENAVLKLSSLKRDKQTGIAKTIFNLTIGKMLAVVDKLLNPESSFEVHTKMAIAAVKGTNLAVNSSGEYDMLGVFDGSVFFTGSDGTGGVNVEGGNESKTGPDGRPGTPRALSEMLKDKEKMEKMRETVKNMMGMKQTGTLALFLEAKKEDAGKDESNGAVNEPEPDNGLKNRLRRDMRETRKRAFAEMGYVTEQTKIDNYLGKSVIDVHGNRVRFEDYVLRPRTDIGGGQSINTEVDYLNLTFRENSLNLLKTSYYFASPLDSVIPENYWYSYWPSYVYASGPANYLDSKSTLITNGKDKIETNTFFELKTGIDWGFSYTQPQVNDKILVKTLEEMKLNGSYMEKREFYDYNFGNTSFEYSMLRNPDYDQTFLDPSQVGRTDDIAYDEVYVNPARLYDRSLIRRYNDGTIIRLDYYFVRDDGTQIFPDGLGDALMNPMELIGSTNIEVKISSNVFNSGSIDLVSKRMWMHMLNPPDRPDSVKYWDLLDPVGTDEFNLIYLDNIP